MPATIDGYVRADLLRYAASIVTDPSDAASVTETAFTLIDWAEQASGEDDLQSRLLALHDQWRNGAARSSARAVPRRAASSPSAV